MSMQAIVYFFHITGLAIWLGSLIIFALQLQQMRHYVDQQEKLLPSLTKLVKWLLNPSAFIVLVSGVALILQMGLMGTTKPFYLNYMEQFGGVVILLSMIVLFIQARGIQKSLAKGQASKHHLQAKARNFAISMIGSTVLILSVVLVVSMKLV